MARRLDLEACWRDRIKEFRQSGLGVKAWCQQNGIKTSTYYYWVNKFGEENRLPSLWYRVTPDIHRKLSNAPLRAKGVFKEPPRRC